jgi:hypothetical protein
MNNIINQIPFLQTSRSFPQDLTQLTVEMNKSYLDIANAVNTRTISIFATLRPVINGESWFLGTQIPGQQSGSQRQTGFRQVFNFTGPGIVVINHGIIVSQIFGFTRIYGTFTDNTNWYPLPYVDITAVSNQVTLLVTATQIGIIPGATAPTIVSGVVVLEWISNI